LSGFVSFFSIFIKEEEQMDKSEKTSESSWLLKPSDDGFVVEIPKDFRADQAVEELSLEDFLDLVIQMNEPEEIEPVRMKHCCVNPPSGTKYTTQTTGGRGVSWCSN
jgi:hypothetical protein